MALFRCTNEECSEDAHGRAIFDFQAPPDAPVCPKCGADKREPEFEHTVIRLETIHFLTKDKAGPIIGRGSRFKLPCVPTEQMKNRRASLVAQAVNCPKCRESAEWKAAYHAATVHPDDDIELTIDAEKQTFVKKS